MFAGGADAAAGLAMWNAFVAGAGTPREVGRCNLTYELADPPVASAGVVALAAPGWATPVLVEPLDFPFRELAGADIEVADLPALPAELRRAVCSGMLAQVRRMLGPLEALPGALTLAEEGAPTGVDATGREWLRLCLTGADGTIEALAGVPRALLLRTLADGVAAAPAGPLAAAVQMDVDLSLGSIRLTSRELVALAPGDVVVLADDPARHFTLRAGTVAFRLTQTQNGWISTGPQAPERPKPTPSAAFARSIMTTENEDGPLHEAEGGDPLDLSELPLAVDFDLARVQLPYASVATWRAGSLIELTPPASDNGVPVTIRVNGAMVGTGDIVRIDERIGVRITRLVAPGR